MPWARRFSQDVSARASPATLPTGAYFCKALKLAELFDNNNWLAHRQPRFDASNKTQVSKFQGFRVSKVLRSPVNVPDPVLPPCNLETLKPCIYTSSFPISHIKDEVPKVSRSCAVAKFQGRMVAKPKHVARGGWLPTTSLSRSRDLATLTPGNSKTLKPGSFET